MRIIGGSQKGRKFYPPKNLPTRPTTDFAKEGLFNVLRSRFNIEGASILDLCAGTGNISYEFCSRDAASVLAVDQNFAAVRFINQTAKELQFSQLRAIKSELFKFLDKANHTFDLIIADPPYAMDGILNIPDKVFNLNVLNIEGLLVVEHSKEIDFQEHSRFSFSKKYGNVNFTFFE